MQFWYRPVIFHILPDLLQTSFFGMHVPPICSNTQYFLTTLWCKLYDTQCHTVSQHEEACHSCIYSYSTWTPLGMLHLSERYPCHTISLSTLFTAPWHVLLQVTVDTQHLLHESQRLNSMGVRPRKHGADSVPYMQSTCHKIMCWDRHGPLYGTPAVWYCSCGIISHTHTHTQ